MKLFLFLLLIPRAFAWPPVFGPEFTFTNSKLEHAMRERGGVQTEANLALLESWKRSLRALCAADSCEVEPTFDRHGPAYRVSFPDGFWYQVGLDTGVIEVQVKPGTRAEFSAKKKLLEKHLFENAGQLGLKPHERLGGGHLNIGLEAAIGDDPLLFRNFIVDQANHPELNLGILGGHSGNSPTISQLSRKGRKALKRVIREFDESPHKNIFALAREIQERAYISNPLGWDHAVEHYQNVRLGSVSHDTVPAERRVEIRGIRPQKSMEEFLLQCELYEKRIEFLKSKVAPIPLNIPRLQDLSKAEIKDRFRSYLDEMGEEQGKFSPLLDERALHSAPAPKGCDSFFSRLLKPLL